ncbi:hypothetical protein [Undibacterium sp. Ji50W]|uniref:hypothetical protein n=1 Tax=Undibacterium sp. Ji50W TaxID=3413041 RepID=UPI003BF59644
MNAPVATYDKKAKHTTPPVTCTPGMNKDKLRDNDKHKMHLLGPQETSDIAEVTRTLINWVSRRNSSGAERDHYPPEWQGSKRKSVLTLPS